MAAKVSKLIIGPVRMSFPWLDKPQPPMEEGQTPKYGMTVLFPPGYDLAPIQAALVEAAREKWGTDKAKWPRLKFPPDGRIQRCEEKANLAGYLPGWHFLGLTSKDRPGVIDAMKQPIGDYKAEVYGGRWCRVSANPFAWDTGKGVRGVSLGLNNVQLLSHDVRFSGKPDAEVEFEEAAEEMQRAGGDWNG